MAARSAQSRTSVKYGRKYGDHYVCTAGSWQIGLSARTGSNPDREKKKKFQAIMIDRARARGFCAGSMIFHDLTDSRERPEISQTRPMRQFPET